MKKFLALALLVCALSLSTFAGDTPSGGRSCNPEVQQCSGGFASRSNEDADVSIVTTIVINTTKFISKLFSR